MSSYRITIEGGPSFDCAATENLVSAAERAGWSLPSSCRAGACGSCEGGIDEGRYVVPGRHGDGPELCAPNSAVKLCRARPRSDLRIRPRDVQPFDAATRKLVAAKVLRLEHIAGEIAVLKLRFPAGVRAKFRAGQYLRVVLDEGEERSFSMANAPHTSDSVELHVRHLPGGRFGAAAFNSMKVGDIVQLRLPLGDFWLRDSDKPALFIAGGTGFAPVQSIVDDLIKRGDTRAVHVYFGARTPALLYRESIVQQWLNKRPGLNYVPVVSSPEQLPEQPWRGRTGLVHEAVLADHPDLSGFQVYACGAPAMVDAARHAFVQHGLPPAEFFCDAFAPAREAEG